MNPPKSIEKLCDSVKASTVNYVSAKMQSKAPLIAETFYRELMNNGNAGLFLNHEKVELQLKLSFTQWAEFVFSPRADLCSKSFNNMHAQIGVIHARIGVPVGLVDYGMQVVKDYCFEIYLTLADKAHLAEGVVYINKLLDTCLSVINAHYHTKHADDKRNAQAFRLKVATSDLSLECEKIKSELITWSRNIITHMVSENVIAIESEADIRHTNCGLWFVHKAGLYFPNSNELSRIQFLIEELSLFMQNKVRHRVGMEKDKLIEVIFYINRVVAEICWLLDQIADKNTQENHSRDPLTQLLSRRFVDGIFKREVSLCHAQNERFGLMMIDIDNFKLVNDTYGHQAGDKVLRDVSSCILQNVRPTDFCFRYGGEEILVLVSAVNRRSLLQKAEQVRLAVQSVDSVLENGERLNVTVSIGVAMYDGHPDYQRTISEADTNLYAAKRTGKNKIILSTNCAV
ncbi:GGDEF domain-containing protein [Alteromonas sp. a30]|uniref:GGDEF domain-containing protein n=1 Tax=Alteromonas sp. a30 TaxID=2730917 RepID=UPI0022821576|nr:GGDEF domain-containing protein [Alteromonas sp. a30]MCY7296152.1 GGDEF domain-containing protein [Alteromonas sp. a30]